MQIFDLRRDEHLAHRCILHDTLACSNRKRRRYNRLYPNGLLITKLLVVMRSRQLEAARCKRSRTANHASLSGGSVTRMRSRALVSSSCNTAYSWAAYSTGSDGILRIRTPGGAVPALGNVTQPMRRFSHNSDARRSGSFPASTHSSGVRGA